MHLNNRGDLGLFLFVCTIDLIIPSKGFRESGVGVSEVLRDQNEVGGGLARVLHVDRVYQHPFTKTESRRSRCALEERVVDTYQSANSAFVSTANLKTRHPTIEGG
jgi:hypothetical protein